MARERDHCRWWGGGGGGRWEVGGGRHAGNSEMRFGTPECKRITLCLVAHFAKKQGGSAFEMMLDFAPKGNACGSIFRRFFRCFVAWEPLSSEHLKNRLPQRSRTGQWSRPTSEMLHSALPRGQHGERIYLCRFNARQWFFLAPTTRG